MRIAVIGSRRSWYTADLVRAAGARHTITPVAFGEMHARVSSTSAAVDVGASPLSAFDAVVVRTMPPGSLEQVVFRMDSLARLEASGVTVMNPARAIEAAVDKYLATAKLQAAGLLVPTTHACQTAGDAMDAFAALGGRAVIKPVFGGEGRGVTLLDDEAMALRAFSLLEQLDAVILLQEYVEHEGADLRLMVIGERVLGMRRANPDDWRTNISRGAKGEPLEVTTELAGLARTAAAAVGAPLAGVDLLPGRDGRLYAIEVNAVPGWRELCRVNGVDVASLVIDLLVEPRPS
ncbi:MAG: RimK family alpha-L-glutamate ligase [Planctomycetota bacterium]